MKKILTVTSLACIFLLKLNAQNIDIDWGKPTTISDENYMNPEYFIGKDDQFIYYLTRNQKLTRSVVFLEKYKVENLTRIYSQKLTLPKCELVKVILIKGKLFFITETQEDKKCLLYSTEIDKNGELTDNKKLIMESSFSPVAGFKKNNYDYYEAVGYDYCFRFFKLAVAEDNNSFYVCPKTIVNGSYSINIIDANLNIKECKFPMTTSENCLVNDFLINGGNAYAIIKTPISKKDKFSDGKLCYKFSFASIDLKKNNIINSAFELKNQQTISYCDISINGNNVIAYGFYGNKIGHSSESKGIFCAKINSRTGTITHELNYDYDDEMMKMFDYVKDKNTIENRLIENLKIQSVIPKTDGGIILVAEKKYKGYTGKYDTYIADNILVMNLSQTMELNYKTIILKKQQGDSWGDGKFNSYYQIYKNGKLYFIYNESPANFDGSEHGKIEKRVLNYRIGKSSEMLIAMVSIDKDGNWKKEVLQKYDDKSGILMPAFSIPLGKDEAIIYAENEKEIKLAHIKY